MSKKTFDEENRKLNEFSKEADAAKKPDNPDTDRLISTLRSDILLTSSTSPAQKNIFQRINLKLLFGILLTLFIIVFIWFFLAGPGRPLLEHNLALLVNIDATATQSEAAIAMTSSATPPGPSNTPVPSMTPRPTSTSTKVVVAVATLQPSTSIPTPTSTSVLSECRDALSITLADVGQTLCVKGIVIETVEKPNAFMVIFSKQPTSFYWVTYDLVWSDAVLDTCYQLTGKIEQIANSPIQLFDYSDLPELCP